MGDGRQRGLMLYELVLVIVLVMILMLVAREKLWPLRVEAERVAVQVSVARMQKALSDELAVRVLQRGLGELAGLATANPVQFLAQPPSGYVGERSGGYEAMPGEWFFDRDGGMLVYRVRHEDDFHSALQGPARIRFQTRLVFDDNDHDGAFDLATDRPRGLILASVDSYRWGTWRVDPH